MNEDPKQNRDNNLYEYRLDELQKSMTVLNGAVSTLSTQIMTLQLSLPDRFLTRLEFSEILRQKEIQQKDIDQRIEDLKEKETAQDKALYELQSQWNSRAFGIIGTAFLAFVSLVIGALNFIGVLLPKGVHTP